MQREGLPGTPELQAYLLNRAQEILSRHGRALAGWDEMSHGGGVNPDGALMMAWQKGEVGPALAEMGYDVIMTPGEAYYLDMAQADDWQESGASWAGTVPPHTTYHFEAAADFGPELIGKLKGVQACIWSESIRSRDRFNRTVFPRLSAIAEAGWTQSAAKNWQRFSANTKLMPEL
jgi:hexosaminidase